MPEAADHAVGDGAAHCQILARVRAVPAELVSNASGLDDHLLVGRSAPLVRFDAREGIRLGVLEQADQVVVVHIRVPPRREAHRQQEVLPADLAEHDRREPARVQPESVFGSAGPALEVDAHPLGAQVDVPASFDGSGYLESHRHVDALEEIRTQFAKAPEVLYKGIAKVRSRLRESGTDCLDLRTPRAGVCVQILVAVAEVKVAPEAVGYMPTG